MGEAWGVSTATTANIDNRSHSGADIDICLFKEMEKILGDSSTSSSFKEGITSFTMCKVGI